MTVSRTYVMAVAAAVFAAIGWAQVATSQETCGEYGTSVVFADSPVEAAKLALKEEKLLFILHVSGLFEEADFT